MGYKLACPGHVWGVWMADMLRVKVPGRVIWLRQGVGHYRRFCRRCNAEQKGRGDAWARDVRLT